MSNRHVSTSIRAPRRAGIIALLLLAGVTGACAGGEDRASGQLPGDSASAADSAAQSNSSASVPPLVVPDTFSSAPDAGGSIYTARRAYDLTKDDRPETLALTVTGPRPDSARVDLLILGVSGDTLYHDKWHTTSYFQYEYRNTFTDSAADARVLQHIRRVLSDSAFRAQPSQFTRSEMDRGMARDAMRYDMKEQAVREKHGVGRAGDLTTAQYQELEAVPVAEATLDSLAATLRTMPTFMYHAGGETSYEVAFSPAHGRFIRVFACC